MNPELQTVLVTVAVAAALMLLPALTRWGFPELRDYLADHVRSQRLDRALAVAEAVVLDQIQEVAPHLRDVASDGVITPNEWGMIAARASMRLKLILGERGVETLRWVFDGQGDEEEILHALVTRAAGRALR